MVTKRSVARLYERYVKRRKLTILENRATNTKSLRKVQT